MANDKVDTRVVKMEFDNKQFEKNIKQTSKSLDNFKQSLDFKDAGDSLEKITVKFSALQVAATTFVVQLTNRLINLGTTLVKSLSVDNISSGWTKFGEKTVSVATIMAQRIRIAGEVIEDTARKTEVVNQALEKLAWFSDETSYSFTNMTDSVGKFIATGQDLDKSVNAIQGIATWAAMAGQNSTTASMAMTQLAQALGAGSVKLQDWKSIENYHMDMEIFKEAALETAVSLGQLTKEGDKFVTKTGKKFDQSSFRQYLSEGWFTSDVLINTLNKYSAAVDDIYRLSEETGKSASEVIEEYGDQLDEFGVKAFKAAQDARTFADVLNYIKDAVASKWMKTFETIFGNQEEAVKLWTSLSEELYNVFVESGNFRNNILSVWKEMGGRDDIFGEHGDKNQGAFWNLYDAIIAVKDLISDAWNMIFPLSTMEKESDQVNDIARNLKSLTNNIKEFTNKLKISEVVQARISKIFQTLFSILRSGIIILQTIRYVIDPIIELAKELVGQILDQILYSTNKLLKVGSKVESFAERVQSILIDIIDTIDLPGFLSEVFSFINDIFKEISNTNPLEKITSWITNFIDAFKEAGGTVDNFKKIFKSVLSVLSLAKDIVLTIIKNIVIYFVPILDDVVDILTQVSGIISGAVIKALSVVAEMIVELINVITKSGDSLTSSDGLLNFIEQIGSIAKSIIPILASFTKIILKFIDIILLIPEMLNTLSKRLTGVGIVDHLIKMFDDIYTAISNFINGITDMQAKPGSFASIFNALIYVIEGLWEVIKGILSIAPLVLTALGTVLKKIGLALQYIADLFIKVFSGRINELTTAEKQVLGVIAALGILAVICVTLYNLIYLILMIFKPWKVLLDSITGVLDSISRSLNSRIFESFANALLKFAISLAILTGLNLNSLRDVIGVLEDFGLLIGLFSIILAAMSVSVTTFSNEIVKVGDEFTSETKSNNLMAQIARFINSFSNAIIKIAISLKILDSVNDQTFDKLERAMLSYSAFFIGIYILIEIINSIKDADKSKSILKSLTALVASFVLLLLAIKILSGIDPGPLWIAIGAVATVIILLTAAIILISKYGSSINIKKTESSVTKYFGIAAIIAALSSVLLSIALSILILSKIPSDNLAAPIISIAALIGTFMFAIYLVLSKTKESSIQQVRNIVIMFGALISSIVVMIGAIAILSTIPWDNLRHSVLAMMGLITLLVGSMLLLSNFFKESSIQQVRNIVIMLGALISSIVVMIGAIVILSKIPWDNLWPSLVAMIGLITLLVGSMLLLSNFSGSKNILFTLLGLSAGMVAISASMLLFAATAKVMQSVGWQTILYGILGFAGGIVILGIAASALAPVIGIMILLASSIFMVGMAVLAAGIGLQAMAAGLTAMNADFAPALENLTGVITSVVAGIISGLLEALPQIATAMLPVLDSLTILIPGLVEVFRATLHGIISIIETEGPGMVNAFTILFYSLADTIKENAYPLGLRLFDAIIRLLDALKDRAHEISSRLFAILVEVLKGLKDNAYNITEQLMLIITEIVESFFANIGPLLDVLERYLFDFLATTIISMSAKATALAGLVAAVALIVIAAALVIVTASLGALGKLFIAFVTGILLVLTYTIIGLQSTLNQVMLVIFKEILKATMNAVFDLASIFKYLGGIIMKMILTGLLEMLYGSFRWVLEIIDFLFGTEMTSTVDKAMDTMNDTLRESALKDVDSINGSIDSIRKSISTASDNIDEAVSLTTETANGAIQDGLNQINGAVTDSMTLLGGTVNTFGQIIGTNFYEGMGNRDNIFGAKIVGSNMGNAVVEGAKDATETHSPSRVFARLGRFLMQGLSLGIQNGASETEDAMAEVISDSLQLATDILDGQEGDDYTIKVGMDISSVEAQTSRIQDIMSGVNDPSITASGRNAGYNARTLERNNRSGETITDDHSTTVTYNNTFNIESTDPQQSADEIDKVLKEQNLRFKLAHGT